MITSPAVRFFDGKDTFTRDMPGSFVRIVTDGSELVRAVNFVGSPRRVNVRLSTASAFFHICTTICESVRSRIRSAVGMDVFSLVLERTFACKELISFTFPRLTTQKERKRAKTTGSP